MADPVDIGINERQENYDDDDREVAGIDGTVFLDRLAGPRGGIIGRRVAAFWLNQIIEVDDDKEFKNWLKRGSSIEKRYRDERRRTTDEDNQRRVNSLWANVEILTPALYGQCPVPVCERRFRDKDPIGRGAAQIIERALRNEIEICGFDEAMRQALRDYLLPGRGTVWVRYEPEYGEGISIPTDDEIDQHDSQGNIRRDEDGDDSFDNHPDIIRDDDNLITEEEEKLRSTGSRVTRESTPVDFIQWTDFYTFPAKARTWKEVTAVGKRVYMTRNQMKRRFGNEIGKAIPFQKDDRKTRRQEDSQQGHEVDEKAQIFEIWDKSREEVVWVAEGYQYLCDRQDDPLQLEKFFPCPRPLYANPTNNTLIPVPDYIQYQDQAIQIDELTQRISMLAKCCKVAGVYNAAAKGIQRLFNESVENEMIPVDDWTAFAEKGGIAGNLSFIPLKEIMGVIEELTKIKERATAEMDRLTGINDVMRGVAEDARETAGAQRMQAAASGTRLQHRQDEIARFARDTLRIMADIMCRHFSDKSLIEVSGALCEEGLGTSMGQCEDPNDMDALILHMIQQGVVPPVQLGPPGVPPGPGGSFSPPGQPSQMGAPSPMGAPPPMMPQGAPPPMAPPGQPPVGQPGAPQGMLPPPQPGMPPGQPPGAPPISPPQPGQFQRFGIHPSQLGFQGPMLPQLPPQMLDKLQGLQRIAKSLKLIRNEKLLGFRVDIEVESTIYADQQQEGQQRTAFLAAVTKYLQQAMQISAMMPQAAPFLGKLMQFGVRGFKIGRDLEQSIEDFCDEATIFAKQHAEQASQQPNPIQLKAQADLAKSQADLQQAHMKMQSDQQQAQAEIQRQQIENQGEIANSQADTQQKALDMEMRKMELQIELTRLQVEKMKAEAALRQEGIKQQTSAHESFMDQQDSALNRAADRENMLMGHAADQQKSALDYAAQQQKHQSEQQKMFLQNAHEHHRMKMEMDQTEMEKEMQKQQMEHDKKQAAMQHKIAQLKLQQQRAAANRPRAQ